MKNKFKTQISKILNIALVLLIIGLIGNYIYKMPAFDQGEKVPVFSSVNKDGSILTSTDLLGDYVLLDFWGSWCGQCRQENPKLKEVYDTFKDSKFDQNSSFKMVSVGIEKDSVRWANAIAKDELNWDNHILQSNRFSSPIAELYGVKNLPTKYLISPEGVVIKTNPTFEDIHQFLSSKLN